MNACEAVRELLTASALKALDQGQAVLVKDHLGGCAECRAVEATTLAAVACIAAPPVEPPAELWDKLRGKLARERGGDEPVRDLDPSAVIAISCSFCRGGLVRNDTVYCASCLAPHHHDCFAEHGRCSVMGCGETRVVRPEGLAPPVRKLEPAPRHRWRWLAGGLIGVATGGAVAALSLRDVPEPPKVAQVAPLSPEVAQVAPEVPRALTPTFPPRLDVEVREATVGELCAQIERAIPIKLHLAPEAAGRALPDRDWWNASWDEVLTHVAAATGLELAKGGEGGPAPWAMLLAPEGESQGAVPPARTWVTAVDVLAADQGQWRLTRLAELPGARALPAPAGSGLMLAIVGDRRVRLSHGGKPVGGLRLAAPVRRAAWAPEGRELDLLCGEPGGPATLMRVEVGGGHLSVSTVHQLVPADADDLIALPDGWVLIGREGGSLEATMLGRGGVQVVLRGPRGVQALSRARVGGDVFSATEGDLWRSQPGYTSWATTLPLDLLSKGKDRVRLLPAAAATRLLVLEPTRARVLDVDGAPRWVDTIARLPADWPAPAAISPDGTWLAWCDAGSLFLRQVGQSGASGLPEVKYPVLDLEDAPRGVAWDSSGHRLAVWCDGSVGVIDRETKGFQRVLELPDGPGAIQEVQWLEDDRLVVSTSLERARSPEVRVFPAREGGDVWARPERLAFAPEVPEPVPAQREEEPLHEEAPTPVREPAAAPQEEPAPVVEPPSARLYHVWAGQRWVFKVGKRSSEEWTITAVRGERVTYVRRVFLDGRPAPVPSEEVEWTPDQLMTGEVRGSRGPDAGHQEGTLTLGAINLGVNIDERGGVELWRAVDGAGRYTFPGVVKRTDKGEVVRELISVGE